MTPTVTNQVIVITTGWPEAFNIMYKTYGDPVNIYGVELMGNMGQICLLDPKYYLQ